jgi:hypothetical protein
MTHDFVGLRTWGHDYTVSKVRDGGLEVSGASWTPSKISVGDYLILENKGSRTGGSRYRVASVRHVQDPPDMAFWDAVFEPRNYDPKTGKFVS